MSKPIMKFRAGRVAAAIWENEMPSGGVAHSVTLDRRYKDGEEWKSSSSLHLRDLPNAILVLTKTFDALASENGDEEGSE